MKTVSNMPNGAVLMACKAARPNPFGRIRKITPESKEAPDPASVDEAGVSVEDIQSRRSSASSAASCFSRSSPKSDRRRNSNDLSEVDGQNDHQLRVRRQRRLHSEGSNMVNELSPNLCHGVKAGASMRKSTSHIPGSMYSTAIKPFLEMEQNSPRPTCSAFHKSTSFKNLFGPNHKKKFEKERERWEEAMQCERVSTRRNALDNPRQMPMPQTTRERLERDLVRRKTSFTRKVSQVFRSMFDDDMEVDLI